MAYATGARNNVTRVAVIEQRGDLTCQATEAIGDDDSHENAAIPAATITSKATQR